MIPGSHHRLYAGVMVIAIAVAMVVTGHGSVGSAMLAALGGVVLITAYEKPK